MHKDLVNRLRGIYHIGLAGEYGKRKFLDFVPPICLEAANRIQVLEDALDGLICECGSYGGAVGASLNMERAVEAYDPYISEKDQEGYES